MFGNERYSYYYGHGGNVEEYREGSFVVVVVLNRNFFRNVNYWMIRQLSCLFIALKRPFAMQ